MFRTLALITLALPVAGIAAPTFHTDDIVGAGLLAAPRYLGSARRESTPVPIVDVERGAWVVRSTQGVPEAAAVLEIAPGVKAGLALSLDAGRRSDDVAAFVGRGVPDLDPGAALGPIVEASLAAGPVPVRLTWRWRQSLQQERGASSDARISTGLYDGGRVRVSGFAQLTWSDSTARTREFGLTDSAAATSGLPVTRFSSGLRDAAVGLALRCDVSGPWSVVASLEHRRLARALREGPVSEAGGGTSAVVGVVYRLR